MKTLLVLLVSLGLMSCSYPVSQVTINDNRPTVLVKNAPKASALYVDNVLVMAEMTTPPKAVILTSGTHLIEVKHNGNTIFSEKLFLSDGTMKTLTVN